MALDKYRELGFSDQDIEFARKTFYRDCPDGCCSKRMFLTFMRKSYAQKCYRSNYNIIRSLQNYRYIKKFFSMMFDVYDRKHDGTLDFDEYMYALAAISGTNVSRTIETLFEFFDFHHQGYITRKEFNSRKKLASRFLGQYKPGLKDSFLYEEAFNTIDKDKDGRISKEEFIEWYLKDDLTSRDETGVKLNKNVSKISTTLTNIKGCIKTSPLQQQYRSKLSADMWLEKAMPDTIENDQELPSTAHVDGYLSRMYHRARNHFDYRKNNFSDDQSDSGICTTASTITTFTGWDSDFDSKTLHDTNEDEGLELSFDNDSEIDLPSQTLEIVHMRITTELEQERMINKRPNVYEQEDEPVQICRL